MLRLSEINLLIKNPDKNDNVVVMMGGLHILFNFMKAIGQHMENSGPDDV